MVMQEAYGDHIRSEIKCESKGRSEKNECEVREDANWHKRSERWHNFVKVLNAIRQTEQEENVEVAHLHCFVRLQRTIRHGWLCQRTSSTKSTVGQVRRR